MSLILDALNRAARERPMEQLPLGQPSVQSTITSYPRMRWAVEAIVVLAVAFFLYTQTNSESAEEKQKVINTDRYPAPQKKPVSKPIVSPTIADISSEPFGQRATPINLNQASSNPNPINGTTKDTTALARKENNGAIRSLYQQQEKMDHEVELIDTSEKPTASDNSLVDNTSEILNSIALLSDQSIRFQRNVPTIEYTVHVYSQSGGFVVLNSEHLKIGDVTTSGLRVVAVLKSSLILEYKDRQFRLIALNSWMNF